jgi:hypothetical protein
VCQQWKRTGQRPVVAVWTTQHLATFLGGGPAGFTHCGGSWRCAGCAAAKRALPAGQGLGNNVETTETQILRQAAVEGRTLFASTGDTGSSCPVAYAAVIGAGNGIVNQGAPITNSPASLPYVVGVGRTVLYTDGNGHRARE